MKPYDKTEETCIYGHFNLNKPASYTLTDGDKLNSPWYYIYNNRKVLLYVDQNGPVKVQYQPPNGILPIKREMGENESKWQVWITSKDLNGGVPVSNFHSPSLRHDLKKPAFTVDWSPEKAVYKASYDEADIITEIFVPSDKATVCMKTTIVNKLDKEVAYSALPTIFPYMNIPQMVAWDLPWWYLSTKMLNQGEMLTFHAQMTSPERDNSLNRSITFNVDFDRDAQIELDMAAFCGNGNFYSPNCVTENTPLRFKMSDAQDMSFGGYQAVYAAKYYFSLKKGETKTLTQVLTIQEDTAYNEQENLYEKGYFDETIYHERMAKTAGFYDELFSKRSIKTENELYNHFINTFAPLEMFWVCSLDRGWPSSMRGIRDCSQDFCGMLPLDEKWTREAIKDMFSHQQRDGWMPRQISTVSREAPHDMRYYCDGGAFLLELIHEYMTFTRDTSFLFDTVYWLNSDEESTILEHIASCVGFYLEEKNIGEHGLCKVWYGDWWDPMDKIGMDGRGETVTVTAQMILALKNMSDMYKWLYSLGKVSESYLALSEKYLAMRDRFIKAMQQHAYNKEGFFNGYFNDNGKWLLSECDPDGEKRVYLVSNAWALIAGFTSKEMQQSIIENVEKECFGRVGYNTNSKGFPVYIDKAGRKGDGTSPGTGSYNHAQSFFARALCVCGDAERAYKATRYILPIEEEYAPVEKTYAPPYAIANSYSNSNQFPHRVGFQFLSGTVSYVLRMVYNFFFGITYGYEGLTISPCIPKAFGNTDVEFTYLGKKFTVQYVKTDKEKKKVSLNGEAHKTETDDNGKTSVFFADGELKEENEIIFEY